MTFLRFHGIDILPPEWVQEEEEPVEEAEQKTDDKQTKRD